jgi:hypothetical protein
VEERKPEIRTCSKGDTSQKKLQVVKNFPFVFFWRTLVLQGKMCYNGLRYHSVAQSVAQNLCVALSK